VSDFIKSIESEQKLPLSASWLHAYKNLLNLEHWSHNLIKGYVYLLGLLSAVLIPLALLFDLFIPIMGRSPAKKKKTQ